MSNFVGYTSDGFPIYNDNGECFIYGNDGFPYPTACPINTTVPPVPTPTYPSGGGGVYIQPGGSWLDDALNTILGITAIQNRASIGASGVNQQQQVNPYSLYAYQNQGLVNPNAQNLGGAAGASLGTFFQKNAFFILGGVVIWMLYKSGRK